MLTVGVDTYISLEDAEILIANICLSSDPAYKKWTELTNADKEVLLRNSCRAINNMVYVGGRATDKQYPMEFPRVDNRPCGIGYRLYISQFYDNGLEEGDTNGDGGISLVKEAQCVNAVYAGYYNDLATNQIGINIQGLTSKQAGPIRESYNTVGNNRSKDVSYEDALKGIFSPKVYALLRPWLSDSRYNI